MHLREIKFPVGILLIALSFTAFPVQFIYAQENDAGLWLTANLEKSITKDFKIIISEEFRFKENYSQLGTVFTNLSLQYKFLKGFSVSGNYRFINKRQLNGMYEIRNRFYLDASYKYKVDKWSFSLRTRFQDQVKRLTFNEVEADPSYYWRNKFSVKYSASAKLSPYVSAEIFYQLNNPDGNEIDELRFVGGADYDFNKKNSVSGYFMIDEELNVNNPVTSYIIGLEYTYAF